MSMKFYRISSEAKSIFMCIGQLGLLLSELPIYVHFVLGSLFSFSLFLMIWILYIFQVVLFSWLYVLYFFHFMCRWMYRWVLILI